MLAAEELGKAFICTLTEAHAGGSGGWEPFRAMVAGQKKHRTKLLGALYLIQRAGELADDPRLLQLAQELSDLTAGDLEAAKMRALYVDVGAGEVATPDMVADHEGAQARARALRREIVAWGVILSAERINDGGAPSS